MTTEATRLSTEIKGRQILATEANRAIEDAFKAIARLHVGVCGCAACIEQNQRTLLVILEAMTLVTKTLDTLSYAAMRARMEKDVPRMLESSESH